jgi:hypothetical protein
MESSYLSWALECELDGAACHSYDDMRTSRVPPYQHKPPSSGADRTSSPSAASHAPNPTPCDLIQSMQCAIRHPEPAPVRSGQPSHGIRGTARDETLAVCQAGCSRWTSAVRPDIPTHPSCRQLQGIRDYRMERRLRSGERILATRSRPVSCEWDADTGPGLGESRYAPGAWYWTC